MNKAWIILALFVLVTAGEAPAKFSPLWDALPPNYTNVIGQELVSNVVLRSRWVNNGWSYVNGATTNIFGSVYRDSITTQAVYFTAAEAEKMTDQLESVMPNYVHPYFSETPDYCFDGWWENDTNYWPGANYPKAEFMDKTGTNAGIVVTGESTNLSVGAVYNAFGEVGPQYTETVTNYPSGLWLKRQNRLNKYTVAEWRYGQEFEYYVAGNPDDAGLGPNAHDPNVNDEFYTEKSTMHGIESYPVFVVNVGTVAYSPSSLKLTYLNYPSSGYVPGSHDFFNEIFTIRQIGEWRTNGIFKKEYTQDGDTFPYPESEFTMASITNQAPYKWVSMGGTLKLIGTPNWVEIYTNGTGTNAVAVTNYRDTVSLVWDKPMTTYEGTEVWDHELLREQLVAHRIVITNMFLTPTENWNWTNSLLHTSLVWSVSQSNDVWGNLPFSINTNGSLYAVDVVTLDDIVLWFWRQSGCPWLEDFDYPEIGWTGAGFPVASQAPYFNYNMDASSSVYQFFGSGTYYATYPGSVSSNNAWSWTATVNANAQGSVYGYGVDSCVGVNGMFTGTPHRVHLYGKHNFNHVGNPSRYYYRTHISDWINDETYISPPYSCWSNMTAGVFTNGACYDGYSSGEVYASWEINYNCSTNIDLISETHICVLSGYDTNPVPIYGQEFYQVADCDTNDPKYIEWVSNMTYEVSAVWSNAITYSTNTVTVYGVMLNYDGHDFDFVTNMPPWSPYEDCDFSKIGITEVSSPLYTTNDPHLGEWNQYDSIVVDSFYSEPCGGVLQQVMNYYTTNTSSECVSYEIARTLNPATVKIWLEPLRYSLPAPADVPIGYAYSREAGQVAVSTNFSYGNQIEGIKVLIEWKDD